MCLLCCCCFSGEDAETEMWTRSNCCGPGWFSCGNLFGRGQDSVDAGGTRTEGNIPTSDNLSLEVTVTFEKHLQKNQIFEASKVLLEREERLYTETTEADGLRPHEEEENHLAADYMVLDNRIVQTLKQSLSAGVVTTEALKSAVKAIYQEEEQDQLWRQRRGESPEWRPKGLKKLHDQTLRDLVKNRMDNPSITAVSGAQEQQSPFQTETCSMGRQLKEDLLIVVDMVKPCYPPETDICNFYARLYHKTFSAKLQQKADVKEEKDKTFLLCWVNDYYPGLLKKQELAGDINAEALGKLLPKKLLDPLEEKFLTKQEAELMTYVNRILDEEMERWNNGKEPQTEDKCYVSNLAVDIIQSINGMGTSAQTVVGDQQKAQRLTSQLKDFMQRFKTFQDMVIKQNKPHSKATVKANLGCVKELRDFLTTKDHLFSEDVRKNCLRVLTDMKETAHTYLLSPVHQLLKPQYRKLGTNDWLKNNPFQTLLDGIEQELQGLQGSKEASHQELISRLYEDITVEYVTRLLKGEVKLKDRDQQNEAYETVKDNAEHLYNVFAQTGANEDWLKEILVKIAEVLRSQDLTNIQMEIAFLGNAYPDLREEHVSALLKLKTNVSKADRKTVKDTLADTLKQVSDSVSDARPFFTKVQVK